MPSQPYRDDDDYRDSREQSPWQHSEASEAADDDEDNLLEFASHEPVNDSQVEQGRFPIPVWLRETSTPNLTKWIPLPIRTTARSVVAWTKGPSPPKVQQIRTVLPVVQEAPLRLLDLVAPKRVHKAGLLAFSWLAWFLTFVLVLRHQAGSGNIEGWGVPGKIWCGASQWGMRNDCGINGNNCRPFDNVGFAFQCPANCASVQVLEPHAVGDQEIVYQPFVIGGGPRSEVDRNPVYRADSFICQAAIHAGIISNERGGCGVVALAGTQNSFPGSDRNGINSTSFDSQFPKSITFLQDISSECGAVDLRWPLLGVTVAFTAILSLFIKSPAVFFTAVFPMLFFHVGIVSDPPNGYDSLDLSSLIIGRFLPAAFVAYVIYRFCVRPQLSSVTAQVEKTILWLGGAWLGCLNNYTFDHIPIQRLTPHDIATQPGAIPALIIIVLLIFAIALGQVYYLRQEGLLRRYLAVYCVMGVFLLLCIASPLALRIHHYILALILLPGTRPQTRPGLLYQGILVGLFISGVARWGFASILETPSSLISGGQPINSPLPNVTAAVLDQSHLRLSWDDPPGRYDGISVLVNDVERHRWYLGEGDQEWSWERRHNGREYFRFGYMAGGGSADYTRASVFERNGSWVVGSPGPS